eukprot:COSAG02_NODE_16_length_56207_cov_9.816122_12_plen_243_part_00
MSTALVTGCLHLVTARNELELASIARLHDRLLHLRHSAEIVRLADVENMARIKTPEVRANGGWDHPFEPPPADGGDNGSAVATESSGEAGTDVSGEAGTDVSGEAGTDVSGEAGTDVSGEAGTDVSGETGTDAPGEAGTNASGDAATDASGEAATDVPESPPNSTAETQPAETEAGPDGNVEGSSPSPRKRKPSDEPGSAQRRKQRTASRDDDEPEMPPRESPRKGRGKATTSPRGKRSSRR